MLIYVLCSDWLLSKPTLFTTEYIDSVMVYNAMDTLTACHYLERAHNDN